MALLEIKDLDVFYGTAQALKKISIEVEEKECVGVIGPNGAGKSTLLDSMIGLTKRRGQVLFSGVEIGKSSPWNVIKKMKIAYVTERRKIFSYMSVRDNLLLGGYNERSTISENLEKVFDLFPILKERQKQEAVTLSGGEQQMLALGKSLMSNPRMLLLDEPTLGLAPIVVGKISEALDKLLKTGVTTLIAEQNVAFTLNHSSRIYVLENGKIVMSGTPDELKSDEYIRKSYFGIA